MPSKSSGQSQYVTSGPAQVQNSRISAGVEHRGQNSAAPSLNHASATTGTPNHLSSIVPDLLNNPGQPLEGDARLEMESRFGHDFSRVKIHTGRQDAETAQALNANAFTVGQHVFFGNGRYSPETIEGFGLLAHELTHTIQQSPFNTSSQDLEIDTHGETEADKNHQLVSHELTGEAPQKLMQLHRPGAGSARASIQLDEFTGQPNVTVRLPAVEEAARQIVAVESGIAGRGLTVEETALVREVFLGSVDYSRVRILPTRLLQFRTVGNTIRVPPNFSIATAQNAETLVHEMTHVWQYQHCGTSYMGISIQEQISAAAGTGARNAAYDYTAAADRSFFSFHPEQQALIVENFHAMRRDQSAPAPPPERANERTYRGNHMDSSGNFNMLTYADRQAEITRELPIHQRYIAQLRMAEPRSETMIQTLPSNFMVMPTIPGVPEREGFIQGMRPILQVQWNLPWERSR